MMLDATKGPQQRLLLEKELEAVGIRLNKQRPNVYFKVCAASAHFSCFYYAKFAF